ncbi:MAG: helix-turn-helix domain-containing protein [Polyangiales bacterium]
MSLQLEILVVDRDGDDPLRATVDSNHWPSAPEERDDKSSRREQASLPVGNRGEPASHALHPVADFPGVRTPFGTPVVQRALSVAEVAKLLGVSTATVYSLCSRGELEHFRVLNSIRVLPEKLIVWRREAHRR